MPVWNAICKLVNSQIDWDHQDRCNRRSEIFTGKLFTPSNNHNFPNFNGIRKAPDYPSKLSINILPRGVLITLIKTYDEAL